MNFKLTSIKFVLIFTTLLYCANNFVIYEKFTQWFVTKGVFDYAGIIAFFFVGLFLSMALVSIFAHKYLLKPFAVFLIVSSAFATYFIEKYNVAIDRSMIWNVIHTNTSESLTLFSINVIPYLFFLVLIPIVFVLKTDITYDKPLKHTFKIVLNFALTLSLAVGFLYLQFNAMHLAGNRSDKYILYQIVPANILVGIGSIIETDIIDKYKSKKKPPKITGSKSSNDDLVVVLAIGETSRQLNFSLYGYNKNTNPLLSKVDDLAVLNGIAKYGSTIWAIPNILSKDDVKLPSVTSHFKIPTSCFVNFQLYGNCGTVPEIEVSNCKYGENCYDEDVIPLLKNDLSSYKSGQKMIVLHFGGGSHGPIYQKRYPVKFQQFTPLCNSPDVINECTKEQLYNSFDNTILYVDFVVSRAIKTLEDAKVPYIFIYLSDHGESLLEGGRVFHGLPPGMTLPSEQAQVPLLVKSSIDIDILKKNEYKQEYIYDTILDLFSIETDILNKDNVFLKLKEKSN